MAERELTRAPGMGGLFARASLGMIPGVSVLPVVGGRRAADVSEEVLVLPDAEVERSRLAAYDRVCGFGLRDTLPATYPHMLAFPLHLALMTDPSFPFPAIGLVHIFNRITQHRPLRAGERVSLRVWAEPIQPHPRGRQVSLRTEARVGEELVWEEVSTNLRRGGGDESATAPEVPSSDGLPAVATWKLPGDLGRRYAGVSGDYNPIHVHPLTARLFGFPSAIAHGMWTKARCLAALEPRLPGAFTVEVAFKRPIVLPAKVNFVEGQEGDETRFGVRGTRKDVPHLDGVVRPA
ncbi:MAG TPA: MaoC/PaaZ C-terminal domain-containing protein [Solirubrobacteraceae bacterium]|nr:MaoC/PaaZ C-terminal domain-containing protein [Solirubrobacteraceae bacterium]